MPSGDNHLVVNLIMIELLGTIFFLAILTVCIYIKRYFVRKSLSGYKALITNGDTNLSQVLAEQLSTKHNCHVILVKSRQPNGVRDQTDSIASHSSAGISVLHCDILDNDDLEQLSQTVQNSFNGIDIVIDNATKGILNTQINTDDCRAFIDVTSEKLRTTINMLMHFIPKMKYSDCGHFVTIQPIISNKKPLLSSYREIKSLINLLTDNQTTFAMDLFNRQKIHLTTIMWNCDDINLKAINSNGHHNNNNGNLEINRIAERILDGIKANRSVVHVNKSINLIGTVQKYFQKKNSSTTNYNQHNKVNR